VSSSLSVLVFVDWIYIHVQITCMQLAPDSTLMEEEDMMKSDDEEMQEQREDQEMEAEGAQEPERIAIKATPSAMEDEQDDEEEEGGEEDEEEPRKTNTKKERGRRRKGSRRRRCVFQHVRVCFCVRECVRARLRVLERERERTRRREMRVKKEEGNVFNCCHQSYMYAAIVVPFGLLVFLPL